MQLIYIYLFFSFIFLHIFLALHKNITLPEKFYQKKNHICGFVRAHPRHYLHKRSNKVVRFFFLSRCIFHLCMRVYAQRAQSIQLIECPRAACTQSSRAPARSRRPIEWISSAGCCAHARIVESI